jgi:hypothetical protein
MHSWPLRLPLALAINLRLHANSSAQCCAVRRLGTGFGGDPCSRFFYYIGNCREYLPRKRRRAKFQILSNAVWLRTWFLQTTYVVQIQRMPWACSILPCTARSASPCLSLLGTSSSLAG